MKKRPLSNIETALTTIETVYPMAIVGVLQLQQAPDVSGLRAALDKMQMRQPLLRAEILWENGRFSFQLLENPPPIALTQIQRESATQWQTIAIEKLNSQFDLANPPYLHCIYLLDETTKTAELIFTFHHAIADANSLLHFYDELLQLCTDPDKEMPTSLSLLPGADDLFPAKWRGVSGAGKMAQFMVRQMMDELRFRRGQGDAPKQQLHKTGECRILTRQLSQTATDQLVQASRQRQMTINSMVSTAMLLAAHGCLYEGAAMMLRAMTFANLRPYLQPPLTNETLGCYIAMMRHTVAIPANPDFWQVAADLQADIYQTNKRGDKFLFSKMSNPLTKMTIRLKKMRLAATAVSYGGVIPLKQQYGSIQLTDLHGFIANNPLGPEFSAFSKIMNGRLSLDILYLDTDMDDPTAHQIADKCISLLQQH